MAGDPLLEEFGKLLAQAKAGGVGGSVELLLGQLEPERARQLELSAIPHQFTPRILEALDPGLSPGEAETACAELAELAVVLDRGEALALHDEARRFLFRRWLAPERAAELEELSRALTDYFDRQVEDTTALLDVQLFRDHPDLRDVKTENASRERMFHLLGIRQDEGFAELRRLFGHRRRSLRLSECQALIDLAHEYDPVLADRNADDLAYHEAVLAADLRRWQQAENLLRSLLERDPLAPRLRAKVTNRLGGLAAEQRRWEDALDLHRKALELAKALPEPGDLVYRIQHDLGVVYRGKRDLVAAETALTSSLGLAAAGGDLPAVAIAANSLGQVERMAGDARSAVALYERSLEVLAETGDAFGTAQVYNNLGMAYADLRDWPRSVEALDRSLELKRRAGDGRGEATALGNRARIHLVQGEEKQAIECYTRAIALFRRVRDWYQAALTSEVLARRHRISREYQSAGGLFRQAIELFRKSGASREEELAREELESTAASPADRRRWRLQNALHGPHRLRERIVPEFPLATFGVLAALGPRIVAALLVGLVPVAIFPIAAGYAVDNPGWWILLVGLLVFSYLFALPFIFGVITTVVSELVLGNRPDVVRSMKRVFGGTLLKLAWTTFLFYASFFLLLFLIVSVIGGLYLAGFLDSFWLQAGVGIGIAIGLFVIVRMSMFPTVVVLEGLSGRKALRRSFRLLQGSFLRYLASFAHIIAVYVFAYSYLAVVDPTDLRSTLVQVLIAPLLPINMVLFYYDLRVRQEGYDNAALAEDLMR